MSFDTSKPVEHAVKIEHRPGGVLAACFNAMASPCEVLFDTQNEAEATALGQIAATETWRIEKKFSRYRPDSVVSAINTSNGNSLIMDEETASLIGFSAQCYELSGGKFDITSGLLRRAWKFDGSDRIPTQAQIDALLPFIGFEKITIRENSIALPAGMEIDLGGCAKEYAVDRVLNLLSKHFSGSVLVNFGGDLATNQAPRHGAWQVGVETPDSEKQTAKLLELEKGALATSGDSKRYLLKHGVRYGHILDPQTGWPVMNGPRSVSVAANTCLEAGMLSTFALLQGANAEAFLNAQGVQYWCLT